MKDNNPFVVVMIIFAAIGGALDLYDGNSGIAGALGGAFVGLVWSFFIVPVWYGVTGRKK